MEHAITLHLPEEVYAPLQESAEKNGTTPEEIAVTWLVAGMEKFTPDPLEEFIGMLASGIPDWGEKHDAYLGGTQIKGHRERDT